MSYLETRNIKERGTQRLTDYRQHKWKREEMKVKQDEDGMDVSITSSVNKLKQSHGDILYNTMNTTQ